MRKDLDEIEKQIEELKRRKQEILEEEKSRKDKEQDKRKKELEDAYAKFYKLLKAYGEDYNVNVKINYSCNSSNNIDDADCPVLLSW